MYIKCFLEVNVHRVFFLLDIVLWHFFEMCLIGDSVESNKQKSMVDMLRKSYSIDVYSNCNWVQVTHMVTMQKKCKSLINVWTITAFLLDCNDTKENTQ